MRFLVIFLLGAVLAACGGGVKNETPLPQSIRKMDLHRVMRDGEADSVITGLHGRPVTAAKNFIGWYQGDGTTGTLYLTVYPDSLQAIKDLNAMASRIRDPEIGGAMGFLHVRELPKYGNQVYLTLQNRRAHFFFVKGSGLYWLEVDPRIAMDAIRELTGRP